MRPFPAALLGLLALTAGLAGCIQGAFFPAVVPNEKLGSWTYDSSNSQGGEQGFAGIVKATWQANVYLRPSQIASVTGALFVISVSNVPLIDEQGEIKKQLDPRVAEYGITLVEKSRGTGSIGADKVSYTVFDATRSDGGATAKGLALDVPYTCGANQEAVRVFGFAATEASSPVFGTHSDMSFWQELAGGAEQGNLGGLVAAVKCS